MFHHIHLGRTDSERRKNLIKLVRTGAITLGGYRKSRIFGLLTCPSGRRMKTENRVFFVDEKEAIAAGYRPCGRCLPESYRMWKQKQYSTP